jgi:hypothetical protein
MEQPPNDDQNLLKDFVTRAPVSFDVNDDKAVKNDKNVGF